jgi:hypothetical protein
MRDAVFDEEAMWR